MKAIDQETEERDAQMLLLAAVIEAGGKIELSQESLTKANERLFKNKWSPGYPAKETLVTLEERSFPGNYIASQGVDRIYKLSCPPDLVHHAAARDDQNSDNAQLKASLELWKRMLTKEERR